ncbi:hypothetical protein BDR26DRAFT_1002907 [Obelidium mucronatum]|nr:hypothetical protein BDR26DRAFT_1002907 [Obelidium mucronatum]
MYKSKSLKSVATGLAAAAAAAPPPPLPTARSSGASIADAAAADATPKASQQTNLNKTPSSLSTNVLTAAVSTSPLAQTTIILRVLITSMGLTKSLRAATGDTVWALKKQVIEKMNKDIKDVLNFAIFVPPGSGKGARGRFLDDKLTLDCCNLEHNSQVEFTLRKRILPPNMEKVSDSDAMPTAKNQKRFMEDLVKGHVDKVRDRCAKGFDANFEIETGEIPLCVAVMQDDAELLQVLLDYGASLDFRCSDSLHCRAAFHVAVANNKLNALRVLLNRGAWIEIPDAQGLTPMYYAVAGSNHECVSKLLELKADVTHIDESGKTLLHTLLNVAGNTPLHLTATRNAVESARRLLIRGADREKTNKFGNTALQMAVLSGSNEVAELIKSFTPDQRSKSCYLSPSLIIVSAKVPPPPQYSPENTPMLPKKASIISTNSEMPIINAYFDASPIFQEASPVSTTAKSPKQTLSKESIQSSKSATPPGFKIPGPPPGPPPNTISFSSPSTLKRGQTISSESRPKSGLSDSISSPRTSQASIKSPTEGVKQKSPHSSIPPPSLRDRVLNAKSTSRPMSLNISRSTSESVLMHVNANRRLSDNGEIKNGVPGSGALGEQSGSIISLRASGESGKFDSNSNIRVSVAPSNGANMMSMGMLGAMKSHRMGSAMSVAPSAVPAVPIGDVDALVNTIAKLKELVQGRLTSHVDVIMAELDSLSTRCRTLERDLESAVARIG